MKTFLRGDSSLSILEPSKATQEGSASSLAQGGTAAENTPQTTATRLDLPEIFEEHQKWLETSGEEGKRAEVSHVRLEGSDLTGANLQRALLHKTILTGADLFMTEFQGACLAQADLERTNLLGTQFRGADLRGASLASATGLQAGQLAGANLYLASLPQPILEFEGRKHVDRIVRSACRLLLAMVLLCVVSWVLAAATRDVQLLTDSPIIPIPYAGAALPTVELYLIAPLLLLGLYLYFHLHLQRLWAGMAELPAVFPDGRRLEEGKSWILMTLARRQFAWMQEQHSPLASLQAGLAALIAYWLLPATLVLYWARYLTRQDLHGTMLHIAALVAALALATILPDWFARGPHQAPGAPAPGWKDKLGGMKLRRRGAVAVSFGVVLALLSLGAIYGDPHNTVSARKPNPAGVREWAADTFWLVGYNPFANLAEREMSKRPPNWSGRDEDMGMVRGARLSNRSLRYADAYLAFLANARLWKADLESANFSEADLRGANLRQANLQNAVLDRAQLQRANLEGADLRNANFARADLRGANLTFAGGAEATLVDARLGGANLYGAYLRAARLMRANLAKADLRDANLEAAHLSFAELQEAYMGSVKLTGAELRGARLDNAILTDASLDHADLRNASLQGAILRGVDLTGANLTGADLRGAPGLSAAQVCAAAEKRDVQMDEALQAQVQSQCGAAIR